MAITGCTGGFMSNPNSEYYIPDSSIQASSEWSSIFKASNGRLHDGNGWYASKGDTNPWIEADLGLPVDGYGIQTQGKYSNWVTTLKVSTFQNVPGSGGDGDFILDRNESKVCKA